MYSLKEIMEYGKQCGLSDIEIITKYLNQDGIGKEAIDVIVSTLENRINKMETRLASIKANMSFSLSFYYKEYDFKTAEMFDKLTRIMMLDLPFSKEDIEWMKTAKVKNGAFWHDLAEAINAIQDESYKPKFFNYTNWNNVKTMIDSINSEE